MACKAMPEFDMDEVYDCQPLPQLASAWRTNFYRDEPPGQFLWRYVPYYQMVDLLVRQNLPFLPPSTMAGMDPTDGRLCSQTLEDDVRMLMTEVAVRQSTIGRDEARNAVRDSTFVSCWTFGDPTYQMWRAFSDLRYGLCLRVRSVDAIRWAQANNLDYGRVFYVRMSSRETPVEFLNIHESAMVFRPPPECPLAWVKDPFFMLEKEFRFATRLALADVADLWVTGDDISRKGRFQAKSIPFEPFQMGDFGSMLDGIELAPFAEDWYVEIVRETVRCLAQRQQDGLGRTLTLAPQGSVPQPRVDRCEAGIRMKTAHGDAEEADRQIKMRLQNMFRFRPESE